MNKENCIIWIIGTNEKDIINKDPKHFCSFITNSKPEKENINELNRFLSEYVGMWYVWKNNLKSKYVGFCHYRRMINYKDINFKDIDGGGIQYFYKFMLTPEYRKNNFIENTEFPFMRRLHNTKHPNFIFDDIDEYLKQQLFIPVEKIKDYCTPKEGKDFPQYIREIYCCEWETFYELMEFINGYIEFISNKYNIKTYDDWKKHISEKVIAYLKSFGVSYAINHMRNNFYLYYQKEGEYLRIFDEDEGISKKCNVWRTYSYVIEDLISVFIGTHRAVSSKK